MNAAQFRQDFPEFSDTSKYPDSSIEFHMSVSVMLVNPMRWGDMTNLGVELLTAHNLTLAIEDVSMAAIGGAPGQIKGPLNNKSVDKVSVGYNSGAVTYGEAGYYNMTRYGTRFYQLAMMFGAGGMIV